MARTAVVAALAAACLMGAATAQAAAATGVYQYSAYTIDGMEVPLSTFAGNVSVVVNVATY